MGPHVLAKVVQNRVSDEFRCFAMREMSHILLHDPAISSRKVRIESFGFAGSVAII